MLLGFSIFSILCLLYSVFVLSTGMKKMKRLEAQPGYNGSSGPKVSIIVPACNEEENISTALQSLLSQDYPNLEIIAVNDRSTDNTGNIIETLAQGQSKLTYHEITALPAGWLGKCYALQVGAGIANGDYLIFTDADVRLEKTVVSRAMNYVANRQLHHLTLIFKNKSPGWLLNSFVLDAGLGLLALFRPWKLSDKKAWYFLGIGAFNMVEKKAYLQIDGHRQIRMQPIDDIILGKFLKRSGCNQDCLLGDDFVTVPWYSSLRQMAIGLEKNMFTILHYRFWAVVPALFIFGVITIFPQWGAVFCTGKTQIACCAAVVIRLLIFLRGLMEQKLPLYYFAGGLITPYITCYVLLRSVFVTMKNKGIVWRGQHYPLGELKKQEPIIF